jgi:hypothetical protein
MCLWTQMRRLPNSETKRETDATKAHSCAPIVYLALSLAILLGVAPVCAAKLIPQVPDANQPPTNTLGVASTSNFCAPMAAVNITEYWDVVMAHPNAIGVNANLGVSTAAEYIGYFMDTNNQGSPARANGTTQLPASGTYTVDQQPGFQEFVRWDAAHPYFTPPPALPANKKGYGWSFTYLDMLMVAHDSLGFNFCAAQIDSGLPLKIDFLYWNPLPTGVAVIDSASNETIDFMDWGPVVSGSSNTNHVENWNLYPGEEGIGHAVTGVGYFRNIDPDGPGPLPNGNYIIVHDNWSDTPLNVAVLWQNWNAAIGVDPALGLVISNPVDLQPYWDWGAISSYAGLPSGGGMGIFTPSHNANFFFPSDSLAPFTGYPKSWLTPGLQAATNYGPDTVRISTGCPVPYGVVTVPDRSGRACSLFVQIPAWSDIDEASDFNVIQLSQGEMVSVAVGDTVETIVFLASADGYVDAAGSPCSDQQLDVFLDYNGGSMDTVSFNDIHPAGRLDIIDPTYPPSWLFIYGNEMYACDPAYFEVAPFFDMYHSGVWHWYALYPDNSKLLDAVHFDRTQVTGAENVYILALSYSKPQSSSLVGVGPSVEGQSGASSLLLSPNRPNPFKPRTEIEFYVPARGHVKLEVFDVQGRRVATLIDEVREAGRHTTTWNADSMSSGIYFCRLEAAGFAEARKMLLLR